MSVRPLLLASATASLVIAQTSTAPTSTAPDRLGRCVHGGSSRPRHDGLRPKLRGLSCAGGEGKAPLVGDAFWKSFAQKSVGDLLEFVSTYMPNGTPGSLTEPTYRDIVALMLKSNGFPAGTTELGREYHRQRADCPEGRKYRAPGRRARSRGRLSDSQRSRLGGHECDHPRAGGARCCGREDATRPLGSRTMALKFVVTKLDALAGSRVAVNGLLIGDGGVDGINVTTVNRVAQKCP